MTWTKKTQTDEMPNSAQLAKELKREEYRERYVRNLRGTVNALLVTAAIVVLLSFLLFPVFRIYGSSMAPTLQEGEIIVALKGSDFECGDVIMLTFNNKILVKRVIAGPGQWVDIDEDGNVYVDEVMLDEPYLPEKAYGECNLNLPYQVGDGRYFVMGDNRSTSQDSRSNVVGCIAEEQIIGRAVLRVWPLNALGTLKDLQQDR